MGWFNVALTKQSEEGAPAAYNYQFGLVAHVERRLSLCDLESGGQGLQGPLPEHVLGGLLVAAQSADHDGVADIYFHADLFQYQRRVVSAFRFVRTGSLQLLCDFLGNRNYVPAGECRASQKTPGPPPNLSDSHCVIQLPAPDHSDRAAAAEHYRVRPRRQCLL